MYNTPYIRVSVGNRPLWRNEKKRNFKTHLGKIAFPASPKVSFLQIGLEEGNPQHDLSWGGKLKYFVLTSTLDNSPIIPIPQNYFL